MKREFYVVIERDEDGMFVGEITSLRGCYAQGRTIEELMTNMREVLALCLQDADPQARAEFIGVQKVVVDDAATHPQG